MAVTFVATEIFALAETKTHTVPVCARGAALFSLAAITSGTHMETGNMMVDLLVKSQIDMGANMYIASMVTNPKDYTTSQFRVGAQPFCNTRLSFNSLEIIE